MSSILLRVCKLYRNALVIKNGQRNPHITEVQKRGFLTAAPLLSTWDKFLNLPPQYSLDDLDNDDQKAKLRQTSNPFDEQTTLFPQKHENYFEPKDVPISQPEPPKIPDLSGKTGNMYELINYFSSHLPDDSKIHEINQIREKWKKQERLRKEKKENEEN